MPAEAARVRRSLDASTGSPRSVPGDDLAALIGDALERTPGRPAAAGDDVLVVTQKIVSKAEGAHRRPDRRRPGRRGRRVRRGASTAIRARSRSCCARPRRVVRMDHGVLITETPHGFVCANGGVDASNVGPGSGSIVTLLPRDPDASAAGIRGRRPRALRPRRAGHRLRLVRPAVALGHRRRRDRRVRACCRSRTCAATPDADGRVMRVDGPRRRRRARLGRRAGPSARRPAARWRSSGARRSPAARARSATWSCPPEMRPVPADGVVRCAT